MTITATLKQALSGIPEGKPFFPAQFLTLGSRAAIDQSLSRLARAGAIMRVARGVYVRPKQNRYVGAVTPEPGVIATSVAEAQGAKVQIHGAEAARRFGLTTQVPMQPVYYTTGPSRRINMGRMQVRLQHVSPRKLMMSERPAGLARLALEHLGKSQVTAEVIRQIQSRLSPEEFEALKSASSAMPAWLAEALNRESRTRA